MAKYSVPGIRFTEIDNTIRSNSLPGLGIGAIVMKSNKGPVNQRILTSSYDNFTDIFGQPENLDDYGHFAAENYLAISNQLLAVRTTMGDEGYAQIQYPYTDADLKDVYRSEDTSNFKYIDNEDNSNLKLLGNLDAVTQVTALSGEEGKEEWIVDDNLSAFGVYQKAAFGTIVDIINDNPPSVAVFKNVGKGDIDPEKFIKASGEYIKFATKVNNRGEVGKMYDDLILTEDAWTTGKLATSSIQFNKSAPLNYISDTLSATGYKTIFSIPADDTLNSESTTLTAYLTKEFADSISAETEVTYKNFFNDDNFYKGSATSSTLCDDPIPSWKIQFRDWDDCVNKTFYVEQSAFEPTVAQAVGIQYREYGMNTLQEALAMNNEDIRVINKEKLVVSVTNLSEVATKQGFDKINSLADQYGCDSSELMADGKYSLLKYFDVWEGIQYDSPDDAELATNEPVEKVIYTKDWEDFTAKYGGTNFDEKLFWTVAEKNAKTPTTLSVYTADPPEGVVIPWQEATQKPDGEPVNKMAAFATSEILNGTNERYKDGYTVSIESDDEPGNGDVEQYVSNKANQLIIASIGPGEYGNDIGISIITPECAEIPALNHQNAFNWKYRYDDEDKVDNEEIDPDTLTWTKVYRINVYVKTKSQTSETAWGTGMDALLKDPAESWYVSNDPTAPNLGMFLMTQLLKMQKVIVCMLQTSLTVIPNTSMFLVIL